MHMSQKWRLVLQLFNLLGGIVGFAVTAWTLNDSSRLGSSPTNEGFALSLAFGIGLLVISGYMIIKSNNFHNWNSLSVVEKGVALSTTIAIGFLAGIFILAFLFSVREAIKQEFEDA